MGCAGGERELGDTHPIEPRGRAPCGVTMERAPEIDSCSVGGRNST